MGRWFSRRGTRAASLFAALAVAAVLVTGAPGALTPPVGDTSAIAFYNHEVGRYGMLPGAKVVETGYFFARPNGGSSVSFWWGRPPPVGYVPQKATILELLSNGKIVAYLAQLTAPKMPRVRVLMAGGSVYLSTRSCWTKAPATSSPLGTGERFLFNDYDTRFLPLVSGGAGSTTVTFTYAWPPGSRARETSTFAAGSTPTVHTTIKVTGKQKMKIVKVITPLTTAPALPVPTPPAIPAPPKPLCGRT